MPAGTTEAGQGEAQQGRGLLLLLSVATFLIFFQAYMVAPLIPRLARIFAVSPEFISLVVPAYLLPYGAAVLFYGPLSDRLGRKPLILTSLGAFILLTGLTGLASSAPALIAMRFVTGLVASGVVPIALAMIGDLFAYEHRGRALGWLFGAMAGGMAFGSSAGAILEPFLGWSGLFFGVALLSGVVFIALARRLAAFPQAGRISAVPAPGWRTVVAALRRLLASARSRRTYAYVLFNAIFHSGVYTWLGYYFAEKHHLGELGIGLALLGYGVPGLLLGPVIGRLADRAGRRLLIPLGVAIGGASAIALALDVPLLLASVFVTTLSLGYDMTQPLLAGIVTDLGAPRGLAMGFNVFTLFIGFGVGSVVFSSLLPFGLSTALLVFGGVTVLAALLAVPFFRAESAPGSR
jgi:predicted MFS family arabinose efflux permease